MASPETVLTPENLLSRMHGAIRNIHGHIQEHKKKNILEKVENDDETFEDQDVLKTFVSKFDYASLNQWFTDARRLAETAKNRPDLIPQIKKSLEEIKKLFDKMVKVQKADIRNARFLARTAHHLASKIKGMDQELDKSLHRIQNHQAHAASHQQQNPNQ